MGYETEFLPADKHKNFLQVDSIIWVCLVRHTQSTINNKFTISLKYLKENVKDEVNFCLLIIVEGLFKVIQYYHFRFVLPGMPKLPKIINLPFLCNILRKKWMIKLIFCMQIIIKTCNKLILWFWWGWSSILKVHKKASLQCFCNIPKKEIKDEVDFLHADKHHSFCKLALSFLKETARHVQSTQNRKLVIFLQYIKKNILQLLLCSIVM